LTLLLQGWLVVAWWLPAPLVGDSLTVDLLFWCSSLGRALAEHVLWACLGASTVLWWLGAKRSAWVVVVLPTLAGAAQLPALAYHARRPAISTLPRLELITANVYAHAREHHALAETLLAQQADLILCQEVSPVWGEVLIAVLGNSYPHHRVAPRSGTTGIAVFSRWPLTAVELWAPAGGPMLSQRIAAGDFNWTASHRSHALLVELGYHDAHADAGWGRGDTWPVGLLRLGLPGWRLDHVYGRGVDFARCEVLPTHGSDHDPLAVTVHAAP
jgi:endonuclease/exonuclease/phosphatase (EEP) superfamily protein YafD